MPEVPGQYHPVICPYCGEQGMPTKSWTCKCGKSTHVAVKPDTESVLAEEYKRDNKICAGWLLHWEDRLEKFNQHAQGVLQRRDDIINKVGAHGQVHPTQVGCVLVRKRGEKRGETYDTWESTLASLAFDKKLVRQGAGHWEPSAGADRNASDVVGDQAIAIVTLTEELAEEQSEMSSWVCLIHDIETELPWKLQTLLKLRREFRFRRGRNGWVAPVQHRYCDAVAKKEKKKVEDVWINDRNTFSDWWTRIVEYTVRLASKRGLL